MSLNHTQNHTQIDERPWTRKRRSHPRRHSSALDCISMDGMGHSVDGMGHDNTAPGESRSTVERLQAQLEQAYRLHTMGLLASGAVHDLCNLLLIIQSSAELLRMALPTADESQQEVEAILLAAQEATLITRQVLSWGRPDMRRPTFCEPGRVLTSLEPLLRRLLPSGIKLVLRVAELEELVALAPFALGQVAFNLAINARDAMPTGGTLTITADAVTPDEEAARALGLRPGRYLALRVVDTGHGIEPATMKRLREPLFTTKDAAGTGLGLAMVLSILQRAHGTLQIQSTPGQGSQFTVYLPTTSGSDLP